MGPFQVFTRAAELLSRQQPGSTPIYSVEVIGCTPKALLVTNCGLRIMAHATFRGVRGKIDTLLIAGGDAVENGETGIELVRWLKRVAGQVRRIGSVCTGAMLLARAGLLNGRKATTHWKWCELLAKKYPSIDVDPDPIFVRDGKVYTSAGVTAGMDLALALVEEDHGSRLALEVARDLVLYSRRPGGQSHPIFPILPDGFRPFANAPQCSAARTECGTSEMGQRAKALIDRRLKDPAFALSARPEDAGLANLAL